MWWESRLLMTPSPTSVTSLHPRSQQTRGGTLRVRTSLATTLPSCRLRHQLVRTVSFNSEKFSVGSPRPSRPASLRCRRIRVTCAASIAKIDEQKNQFINAYIKNLGWGTRREVCPVWTDHLHRPCLLSWCCYYTIVGPHPFELPFY